MQAVGDGCQVFRRQVLEELDGLQDLLMGGALHKDGGGKNVPEACTVQRPQHATRLGLRCYWQSATSCTYSYLHGGCSWCVVQERQLAKGALVDIGVLDDAVPDGLKGSLLHEVAVVTLVTLPGFDVQCVQALGRMRTHLMTVAPASTGT